MSVSSGRRAPTTQPYSLPIVFQDLRTSESLFQVFDSLENLSNVVDNVFSKISARVVEQNNKLIEVGNRLAIAQAKVNHISGTKKATTVFSPAKYPAGGPVHHYEPIFAQVDPQPIKTSSYKLSQDLEKPMISYDPKNEDVLLSETTMIRTDPSKEGLGRLPEHLPSVSSLLLFNTQENPYKKYVSLDNLIGREVHKREEQVKKGLGEAPKTFTEGDHLPGVGGLEYNYKPVLGAIPEFNLPSALPLPNIAELNYSSDLASIAPSHSNAELPSVDLNPSMNGNVLTSPVPPSPAPIPSVQSTSLSISTPSLPPVTSAPPPPPSLPPVTSTPPPPPPSSQAIEPPTPSSAIDEPASSDRSDLLAQIRSGTKLRSVSARKLDAKPKKNAKAESAKPKGSGDIYTDLMQALKRRRVGIADKQQEKSKTREEEDFGAPPDDEWK